ncbi:MAG: NAD/NADP octopine/nopaline dehydrogenase family protein [Burkholderiales bacterium]
MARVAIVGAGAVARAYAVLLAREGHAPALWSPRGEGLRDLGDGGATAPAPGGYSVTARRVVVRGEGLVTGEYPVSVIAVPEALADADVVLVAVPANAYAGTLPRIAPHLRTGQVVFVSGALSLAPLWLAELAARHGGRPTLAASGTTVATARVRDGGVAVNTIRTRMAVAALPVAATPAVIATLTGLFGDRFDAAGDVLAVTLSNINPVAHSAMALTNLTRMEYGEAWPQYHYLTPAVARLVGAMDAERRDVAAAFGHDLAAIEAHFQRSFDVPQETLAAIAAELHRRRGGPPGPTALDSRFVLEDVPFGLACNEALARIAQVPVPATSATITVLATLYGRDFRRENPLLDALSLPAATPAALTARCR